MINLLDYVLDSDDNFWIINYIDDDLKGYMVYKVDEKGTRYNNITQKFYTKNIQTNFEIIPKDIKKVFTPKKFYQNNKNNLPDIWKKYVIALNEVGIKDEDIGIFGSYLIGFDIIKDVDFVIYGKENMQLYYENNELIKKKINATFITDEHILYQYNKHKDKYPKKTDLLEIISRNWSGVQITKGVLSTPRFIDLDNQKVPIIKGKVKKVVCEVVDGLETSMLPRKAKVLYKGDNYKLLTNLWKYQSFAHKGDIIECMAYVDDINKTILISNYDLYLKFIKKSKIID